MAIGVDKAVVARLHRSGQKFEILIDPNKALEFKKGVKIDMSEIIAFPGIYHDVRNTERVPEQDLQKAFGTIDVIKIAEKIIREGELQLTTEQRRQMIDQKKAQIASIISRRAINPQTNAPHPPQRIINAIDKAGINIDPFMGAEQQIEKIVKNIKTIIPIKFQNVVIRFKIPSQFAGKAYTTLKASGTIISEQWLNDGSLQMDLKMMAGVQDELFKKIADMTHGAFETNTIKREDIL
jgi:ribosome maturation protein SDO1